MDNKNYYQLVFGENAIFYALCGMSVGVLKWLVHYSLSWTEGVEWVAGSYHISSLVYRVMGGALGGLMASSVCLPLSTSLLYSIFFSSYFEHVVPSFSSNPSQYYSLIVIVVLLGVLLRGTFYLAKRYLLIDVRNEGLLTFIIGSVFCMVYFFLLHFFLLRDRWNSFVSNVT